MITSPHGAERLHGNPWCQTGGHFYYGRAIAKLIEGRNYFQTAGDEHRFVRSFNGGPTGLSPARR